MNVMYEWNNKDLNITLYATEEQAKEYEIENNLKLNKGGKIKSVLNTKTGELFSI